MRIKIDNKVHCSHQLAFVYMEGKAPEMVDHIDRDGTNNKWCNLQAASYEINNKNKSLHSNNTSGITGIFWEKRVGKWRGRLNISGKRKDIGYFDDIKEAERAMISARRKAGYSEGHGSKRGINNA